MAEPGTDEPGTDELGSLPAGSSAATGTATVRYFAAARAAATGTSQEQFAIRGTHTVAELLAAAVHRHGPKLATVLQRCSYLLDAVAVHTTDEIVADGQVLDILPPFAGG